MSLNLEKETMMNLVETGKNKDLVFVIKNMNPRCDLPINFYVTAITKTRPHDDYEDWDLGQILTKLLFETVDGKIPIMECLKMKNNNADLIKWVLFSLDENFIENTIPTHGLIEIYDENDCMKLFEYAGEHLKKRIVEDFCLAIGVTNTACHLVKKYVSIGYVDIKKLALWALAKHILLPPKTILEDFVHSDNNRAQEFGIYYLLHCSRNYISFDEFAKIPYLDEEIVKVAGNCSDARTNLLNEWASSNDYYKKLAAAYFAQNHRTPETKVIARKLLTDSEVAVRREALVAFARFKNVSKRRVLKEFYRPKNDVFRTDKHLLIDCFDEKDEILTYLLSLPWREYKRVTMAYVNELEYYGKKTPLIFKDIIYMIDDKDIQYRLTAILFDEIGNLSDWGLYFEALILSKIIYIECLGDVVAVAKPIPNLGCPCLKIIDIVGDFYGEKIAMLEKYNCVFPSSPNRDLKMGKTYVINADNSMPAKILSNNI